MQHHTSYSPLWREVLSKYTMSLLPAEEIDTRAWDRCICNSPNETPMAYSWVLDYLSPGWQGLVIGRYEAVMPLKIDKRWKFRLIQMPADTQNLGLFSPLTELRNISTHIFQHSLFRSFPFIHYNFTPNETRMTKESQNNIHHIPSCETCQTNNLSISNNDKVSPSEINKDTSVYQRNTFELSLNQNYETIFGHFSKAHKKNVRRFLRNKLIIEKNTDPSAYKRIQQYKAKEKRVLFTPSQHNQNFTKLIQKAIEKKKGEILTIQKNQETIGACFFLFGEHRIILFHITNNTGRELKTTFGLINHFLKEHSHNEKTLDFAGSDIENIALFNQGFGATLKTYPVFYKNKLPLIVKKAKEVHAGRTIKRWIENLKH